MNDRFKVIVETMNVRDRLLNEVQINNRVCPLPMKWKELYDMLPGKKRNGAGWEPPLPLILSAWWDTPNLLKTIRLEEHIDWAVSNGVADMVHEFLIQLEESDWHHYKD